MRFSVQRNLRGFTLIELLIVIVIIGVLAVAVLSAINPVEQIDKAQDTELRADSAEVLNALERYYASFAEYPWDRVTGSTTPPTPGGTEEFVSDYIGGGEWFDDPAAGLVVTGEVKNEFISRPRLDELQVWYNATTKQVRICFQPESDTFSNQADGAYNATGGAVTTGGTHLCVPQ